MTDYYQNHRRYVKSRDDVQLLAGAEDLVKSHADCDPYDKTPDGDPIAPCGAIANSLFNDTFFLIECPTGSCDDVQISDADLLQPANIAGRKEMSGADISWNTDKVIQVNIRQTLINHF